MRPGDIPQHAGMDTGEILCQEKTREFFCFYEGDRCVKFPLITEGIIPPVAGVFSALRSRDAPWQVTVTAGPGPGKFILVCFHELLHQGVDGVHISALSSRTDR
jgi:hypothetical protein